MEFCFLLCCYCLRMLVISSEVFFEIARECDRTHVCAWSLTQTQFQAADFVICQEFQ
jgi:hypothetical protein